MAYVGSAPQARSGHRQQRRGRGLAVGAGDGEHPPAGHHRLRAPPSAAGSAARGRGASSTSGLSSRAAVVTTTVSASPTWLGVVGRGGRARRARAATARNGVSWSSLPVTGTPCRAMIRAIADSAAPPMPTKWTRPSSVGGQDLVGDRDLHRAPPAASRIIRASFSSASSGIRWAAAAPIAAQPRGVGEQRHGVRRDPLGRQRRVVDQQPAAGLDHGAGVEGLLAVADRQRDEDRRQPDRGHLGHACWTRSGRARRRPRSRRGPSGRRSRPRRRARRSSGGGTVVAPGR